jgi:serine kinase of HPr protein (carbohydrate metabolism regulator)
MKMTLHSTAVAIRSPQGECGAVLLRGASGSGKSDLAFRLIGLGAELICDDQVMLERHNDVLLASSIAAIHGLLEIRGVGLVKYAVSPPTPVRLIIDLVPKGQVPRLPDWEKLDILGIEVPRLKLFAHSASTPLKIIKAIELSFSPQLLI